MPPKSTKIEFIAKAIAIHGDQYDYSDVIYVNNATHMNIKCTQCGKTNPITPNKHLTGRGCPTQECINLKQSNTRATSDDVQSGSKTRLTLQEFIAKAEAIHGKQFDYSESVYINTHTEIQIKCINCDKVFYQSPHSHLKGKGCLPCSNLRRGLAQTKPFEYWVDKCSGNHAEGSYDYSKPETRESYTNSNSMVLIWCVKCSQFFSQLASGHAEGYGCSSCCKSKSETACRAIFQELMNLPTYSPNFASGYPDWLRGESGHQLEIDGWYSEIGLAWEYQGLQHSEYIEHWHKTPENFKHRQDLDERKRVLCKANNITLIEIPHIYTFRHPGPMRAFILGKLIEHEFILEYKK